MSKIAVLFRTHFVNEHVLNQYIRLRDAAPPNIDVIFACDESSREISVPDDVNKFSHSTADSNTLGLLHFRPRQHLWYCGDYVLYFFYNQHPEYTHYYMVEFDLYFTDAGIQRFFDGINNNRNVDFMGLFIHQRDNWHWNQSAKPLYPKVFGTLFPLVGVSNALAGRLLSKRLIQTVAYKNREFRVWPHCEAFISSEVMNSSAYSVASADEIFDISKRFCWWKTPMCIDALTSEELNAGILHPVLDRDSYIAKIKRLSESMGLDEYLKKHPSVQKTLNTIEYISQ